MWHATDDEFSESLSVELADDEETFSSDSDDGPSTDDCASKCRNCKQKSAPPTKGTTRKQTLCFKRVPYRNYRTGKGKKIAEEAVIRLVNAPYPIPRGFVTNLSNELGIPEGTLRRWYGGIRDDSPWRPWETAHGQHLRIFTDEEEVALACYVRDNYIKPGYLFTDSDFRLAAFQSYLEKHRDDDAYTRLNFLCSSTFIQDFRQRNRFSLRVAHYKRRPENVEPAKIEEFIATVKHYMETIDNDRIINIDETSWLLWPRGLLTWADTGAHSVQVRIQGDEKESMTATAAISASGTKLPLQIIAKGKTERVEQSQLGDVAYHWKSHCESGWQNESTFMDYLTKLKLFLGEGPTVVILDCYTAHRTENVKEKAKELGITLCFIPPGMTDELQPLDRSVFAVLKATARRLFHERCMHAPLVKRSKEEACQDLIAAWEHVGLTTIEDAWEIYV